MAPRNNESLKNLILLISILVFTVFTPALSQPEDQELPEIMAVIIEFEEGPLARFKTIDTPAFPKAKENLRAIRNHLLKDIHKLENDLYKSAGLNPSLAKRPEFDFTYEIVFSGVALTVSAAITPEIKLLDYVKEVHEDEVMELFLDVSVGRIQADLVHDMGYDGTDAVIAVADTGIDYTHPDFGGDGVGGDCTCLKLKLGQCPKFSQYFLDAETRIRSTDPEACRDQFPGDDPDGPMDIQGHGTHVSGIAAANDNTATGGITGVAPGAKLMAVRVCRVGGCPGSWILGGLEYIADPDGDPLTPSPVDVVNLSLGGDGGPLTPLSVACNNLADIRWWADQGHFGIVVVIAAGNVGRGDGWLGGRYGHIGQPGSARRVVTVGATHKDEEHTLSEFSSRGYVWAREFVVGPELSIASRNIKPDLVAPGGKGIGCSTCKCDICPPLVGPHDDDICSARWSTSRSCDSLDPEERTCIGTTDHVAVPGTSMSSPHVAGMAALLVDAHLRMPGDPCGDLSGTVSGVECWNSLEISKALIQTAKPEYEIDVFQGGTGFADAWEAVKAPVALYLLHEEPEVGEWIKSTFYNFTFFDDMSTTTFTDERDFFLSNLQTNDDTVNLSVEGSLPAGITVSFSLGNVVNLDGRVLEDGKNVEAKRMTMTINVDNSVVPASGSHLNHYEAYIRVESQATGKVIRQPFAIFIEKKVLLHVINLAYDPDFYPGEPSEEANKWVAFRSSDHKYVKERARVFECEVVGSAAECTEEAFLSPGTYDIVVATHDWGLPYGVRLPSFSYLLLKNVNITWSTPEVLFDRSLATKRIDWQLVNELGEPLFLWGGSWQTEFKYHDHYLNVSSSSMFPPLPMWFIPQPPFSTELVIRFYAALGTVQENFYSFTDESWDFSDDIIFTNDPADFLHLQTMIDSDDDWLRLGTSYDNYWDTSAFLSWFVTPRQWLDWYLHKPTYMHDNSFMTGSLTSIYGENYFRFPLLDNYDAEYADVYQISGFAFEPEPKSNVFAQKNNGDLLVLNTGPIVPFVKQKNLPDEVRVISSVLSLPGIYQGQMEDFPDAYFDSQLCSAGGGDCYDKPLLNFASPPGIFDKYPYSCRIVTTLDGFNYQRVANKLTPGRYTLVIPSDTYYTYYIDTEPGVTRYITNMDTSSPTDRDPPYIIYFHIERDGLETEVFHPETVNKVWFSVRDDVDPIDIGFIKFGYRVHGSGDPYTEYPISCVGGDCVAVAPDMRGLGDMYLDLGIWAEDTSGNILAVTMEPAVKYEDRFQSGTLFLGDGANPYIYRYSPNNRQIRPWANISPILFDPQLCNGTYCGQVLHISGLAYDQATQDLYFSFLWYNWYTDESISAVGKIDPNKTLTLVAREVTPGEYGFAEFGYDIDMDSAGNLYVTTGDGKLLHINIFAPPPGNITTIFDGDGTGIDGLLHPLEIKELPGGLEWIIAPELDGSNRLIYIEIDPTQPPESQYLNYDFITAPAELNIAWVAATAFDDFTKDLYLYTHEQTALIYKMDDTLNFSKFAELERYYGFNPSEIEVDPRTGDLVLMHPLWDVPECLPDGTKNWGTIWPQGGTGLFKVYELDPFYTDCNLAQNRIDITGAGAIGDLIFAVVSVP